MPSESERLLRDVGDTSSQAGRLLKDIGDMSHKPERPLRNMCDTSSDALNTTWVTPGLNPDVCYSTYRKGQMDGQTDGRTDGYI
ncbi:unnamed protein product [Heligmosomoides polygyrus]|uniref:Fibronectin type-III domain-containing protein n=1 Tax=Heligmosomoides polygyrus TaxID=6339 RepID=A0A183FMP8_HELPZ|nr:unnamed protein product [Heligmosomoides polygyrus]